MNKFLRLLSISVVLFALSLIPLFAQVGQGASPQRPLMQATSLAADALVLVNSTSAEYADFQHFIQPYLDQFGVPYTVLDIAAEPVGVDISDYALIIVGHRELDTGLAYLDATEQGNITTAVNAGTGLVNFDNALSTGTTGYYQFIDDIFSFGYSTPGSGSGVSFTAEGGAGYQINCWEDDHQDPVLTTFTDATLFNDTDGEWDEFLYLGNRDYPGVFAGIPEANGSTLETFHCFGDVPNGTYDVMANLYRSRDWRYWWGYTAGDPRTNSYDMTSGTVGDFTEFEIDTITITDGSFDIYMNYGEDLGGTAFEYYGWSWIRLVPTSAPPPVMHYITERHEAGETISTGSMTMAGISLPADADALAMTGAQPFLAVRDYGQGKAVQFGSYNWISTSVKGPVYGLDDLVWRSIVWAARKPFVIQGLPNFFTMRVDDESGPFNWIHIANEFGFIPWAGLFFHNVDASEAADLSSLTNSNNATAAIHAFNGAFFYFDHSGSDWPDATMAAYYAEGTQWHLDNNIPIAKWVLPHYYEFGTNVFQGLSDWGVEFVGTQQNPGTGYGSAWIMNGPYRLYETGSSSWGGPGYYADFMSVPGHPEFDGQFFNCVTEIRDDAGYEWYPSNDVPTSIGRGVRQSKRSFDSMVLTTLFTHGQHISGITDANWRAILQGITDELAPYNPIYVSIDYACQYVRAMHTSDITSSVYDADTRQLTVSLGGETDLDTMFFLFTEQAGDIQHIMVDVPLFSGTTDVVYTLAGPVDQIVVSPNPATVAIGGVQQFSADGFDIENNPIPNLPFVWNIVNGGGTIDAFGELTAGMTAGNFADTVEASYGGVSGYASVDVVSPSLDHFTFDPIVNPQYLNAPFMVTITARDISGNPLLGYSDTATLSDSTGTINPTTTGSFSNGTWTGLVSIGQIAHDVVITANDGEESGTSNPFEVEGAPSYYRVTSPSYLQVAGVSFPVTVTAFETQIDLWEDSHQNPVLATTTDALDLSETDGAWTEFLYTTGRPYPSILAHHLEYEDYDLPMMHFFAGGIPNGQYEVIANLYDTSNMEYFYGFNPADPMAYSVVTAGGATGEQHTQHSLGVVEITDNNFHLYVQDANMLSGTYGYFGWAWVQLLPVTPSDTTINLWEDDHQDPDLVTTEIVADLIATDGQWTEFLYTASRPYPSILAHHREYEDHGLPMMHFSANGIPNGQYEVMANLYDSWSFEYYFGFDPADPMAHSVVTAGGATGEQHTEYSLGTIEITDGNFHLYAQDAEMLSGTYGFFGWAWIRLVPENLITMSASSGTLLFDGNENGTFGEPGDQFQTLVNGTFDINAMDSAPGVSIVITATDVLGQLGYNTYRIRPNEVWVDDDYTAATPGWNNTHFAILATALNAVSDGGTVHVAAGIYTESLTQDRNLTVICEGDITLDGDLVLQSGSFTAPSGTFTLYGNFTHTGGTFDPNGGMIAFAGGTNQNIALAILTTFHNLTIGNGTILEETNPGDNAALTGTLTNNGTLVVQRSSFSTGPLTFGLANVEMDVVALGTLTSLRIERIDANHPLATEMIQTGRYWSITPNYGASGFEVSLTLPHNTLPDSLDKLCRYTGTSWDCAMSSFDTGNLTITRDGVTEFSDWATGNDVGPTAIRDVKISAYASPVYVLALLALGLIGGLGILIFLRRKQSPIRAD